MKSLVLTEYKRLEIQDMPAPEAGSREVRVRVHSCGICGSDVHGYDGSSGRRIPPLIMGHEAAGTVDAVGEGVTRVRQGDKFVADIECGPGEWLGVTVDGAYAPYMRVPEHVAYRIPDHVSLDHACLADRSSPRTI